MAFSLKFNGVTPPPFLKVTGIDQSILPDIEHYKREDKELEKLEILVNLEG